MIVADEAPDDGEVWRRDGALSLFMKEGETIKVHTETREFAGRV